MFTLIKRIYNRHYLQIEDSHFLQNLIIFKKIYSFMGTTQVELSKKN